MRKPPLPLEEIPALAQRWCQELGLQVEAQYRPSGDEELFPNRLLLTGSGVEALLGNRGQALDALQFLIHEAQNQREESKLVYLDVDGMRLFRMKELVSMAAFAIEKAKSLGSYTFQSLSSRERRWIHMVVARTPGFTTESEGTGTHKALKVFKA